MMAANQWARAKNAYSRALLERPQSGFALYGLALSDEKSGSIGIATKEYRDFLSAWKDANPALPQLLHAHVFLSEHPVGVNTDQKR